MEPAKAERMRIRSAFYFFSTDDHFTNGTVLFDFDLAPSASRRRFGLNVYEKSYKSFSKMAPYLNVG